MTTLHAETDVTERTREAALRWKAAWEQHWPAQTLREVLPLYAEDAIFRAFAHRDGDVGHDAIQTTFDTFESVTSDLTCRFGDPLVAGSRAVVEWWASWMEDGTAMSMAGMSTLRFNEDGLVAESRDYWNSVQGASTPYDGW